MTFSALDSGLVGPLFATDAMRACFSDGAQLTAMLQAESALARAQASLGLVPDALSASLDAIGADDLDLAALGRATILAGVPTIPFVKAVQGRLPPDLERGFHKGATTQDIMDTALVLQCRDGLALVARALEGIMAGLSTLAIKHRATPCIGRTYGQHAAPVTFGFKAAIWLAGITEVAARLPNIRANLLVASLAGPVGTLTALQSQAEAVAEAFAKELHLGAAPIAWHTRRGRIAEAGCWLAQVIGTLGKMATDVAHLVSTEVGEVAEPYVPGRGGSSAMPHKRNPVSCTVILAAHGVAPGLAATLLGAMAGAHERPAGLWHTEWHALPSLFGLASGALREAESLAGGLEVDPKRMLANLDITNGLLFADAATALLGRFLGRETAHSLIEKAAAEVRETGRTLQSVLSLHAEVATAGLDIAPAFDLAPAIAAAGPWIDRAVAHAADVRARLSVP